MTNTNMSLSEKIVGEINRKFKSVCKAYVTPKGNIQLTSTKRQHMEMWELEELLEGVFEFVSYEFNIDFNIKNFHKNSLIVEVFEY